MQKKSEKLKAIVQYMELLKSPEGKTIEEKRLFADVELTRRLIRLFVKGVIISKEGVEIQMNS